MLGREAAEAYAPVNKLMAIPLKQLIADRSIISRLGANPTRCCHCGVVLQTTITGREQTAAGEACSDCYYEKLGEAVESHPIVSGRVGRG